MSRPTPVAADKKREALAQVLASETFARSEQLRNFLRYVCELEIAGRGSEINEYLIGVEALGRPSTYSPGEDSSVRSRAYELRQKLHRYYESEDAAAEIRIEFSKGSYAPRFVSGANDVPPPPSDGPAEKLTPSRSSPDWKSTARVAALTAVVTAVACFAAFTLLPRTTSHGATVLEEAWGPLIRPDSNVLICLGTNLYLIVRPNIPELPKSTPKYEAFPELYDWYRRHRPLRDGAKLEMHPTESIAIGEMSGVVAATNVLRQFHTSFQVLPERAAPLASLRGRNLILFGVPITSEAATALLGHAAWTVDFDPGLNDMVIRENSANAVTSFAPTRGEDRTYIDVFGLITVFPSPGSAGGEPHRTVVISGITSVGSHGAMEFFASAAAMQDLRNRFQKEGQSGFPNAYQVVVRCKANDTLLLSYEYAAHRVLR